MTITQNSEYILTHPFFRDAIDSFKSGDEKDLKFILNTLQEDMYHKMIHACAKRFKRFKHENFPIIEEEIRVTAPPDCLSIKLPIPPPKPECKLIVLKTTGRRTFKNRLINTLQLEFDFTKKAQPEIRIAL